MLCQKVHQRIQHIQIPVSWLGITKLSLWFLLFNWLATQVHFCTQYNQNFRIYIITSLHVYTIKEFPSTKTIKALDKPQLRKILQSDIRRTYAVSSFISQTPNILGIKWKGLQIFIFFNLVSWDIHLTNPTYPWDKMKKTPDIYIL